MTFSTVCLRFHRCIRPGKYELTHWGRVTHICVGNLTIIVSDNGLSPGRRQAITWTNVGILLIGTLGTNFSEMLIEIHTFSFKKIHLKMSSGKWWPFCLGLNVLKGGACCKPLKCMGIACIGRMATDMLQCGGATTLMIHGMCGEYELNKQGGWICSWSYVRLALPSHQMSWYLNANMANLTFANFASGQLMFLCNS